ncbi:MAG: CoB--CoM heterodisulfide reductase iron-sulfur subunit B family protein [Treponema sp.]|jgi:heterodisulfide reductase subunit B|nr:CoB--CoM heterodisulfide reductase iron-sulfur subunit B family protein [Treponema sp.]
MVYSYFPGCTLKTKAKELDKNARLSAEALGFTLEEVDEWQCCGAIYPMGTDEIATKLACIRYLHASEKKGHDLVTLCSACHHVFKRVNNDVLTDKTFRDTVNNYLAQEEEPYRYTGGTKVIHYLEVLKNHVGFDTIASKVKNPLTGRKIGAYYGCLLLRPSGVMQFDDPENPTIFEDFIKALGAEPVIYPLRNECCGGYISLKEKEMSQEMVQKITESAVSKGTHELITACPLCMYNVNKFSGDDMSVVYFTELLAEALGVKQAQ